MKTESGQIVIPPFLLHRLADIFEDMDRAYQTASRHYAFQCNGCDENCCMTHFFHHTHLEYHYLMEGIRKLEGNLQKTVFEKAADVAQQSEFAGKPGEPVRIMCPLNHDGLCLVYHHRPMICRLHGIPHELHPPGKPAVYGPGCNQFDAQCGTRQYTPFDRTPFYASIARLEKELKQHTGITAKFKKTIAQMLVEHNEIDRY